MKVLNVLLILLVTLLALPSGISCVETSCYDSFGKAQQCYPEFVNAAYNAKMVESTSTCGQTGPQEYCWISGGMENSCGHMCDASQPGQGHPVEYMTDDDSGKEATWWQSETLFDRRDDWLDSRQHGVNITLRLGKAYDITYIRLHFRSPRPESFAIYKKTSEDSDWTPYQFYSGTCSDTYNRPVQRFLFSTDNQDAALCTDRYSELTPLSGGTVSFSLLMGRPGAFNNDKSPVLQDWVRATDIRIVLTRLNTFGDEMFGDPKILRSYFYAIEDLVIGARCKCNGHASSCERDNTDNMVCVCEHNTMGADCEMCEPFYNDRAWAMATVLDGMECLPCNCNGKSNKCFYDDELYKRTGHGGHCLNCADNRTGVHCERCLRYYYLDEETQECMPCNCDSLREPECEYYYTDAETENCIPCTCHTTGSLSLQCGEGGRCRCKDGVTGLTCDRCMDNHYGFGYHGCRPCDCAVKGSLNNEPQCDSLTGECRCKKYVEGQQCDRCKSGYFGLHKENPYGCIAWDCKSEHPTTCPDGYKTIGSMCYAVLPLSVNWPEAQSLCDTFGGDVLQIDTDTAMSSVVSLFNQAHSTAYWLDASDVMVPGTWKYHGREARTLTYTKWGQGQPSGNQGTRCAAVQPGTGTWVALPCTSTALVICQIELARDDLVG